jgi:transcriptional repressor NrdR
VKCPLCGSLEDKVLESRSLAGGEAIRRRRECISCSYRFTSYERIEEKSLMVVKRSQRREPFSRDKLEKGIQQALRKRPVSQLQIEEIVSEMEEQAIMTAGNSHEIQSTKLGKMVLDKLYLLDRVAYIRFASVYRNFENVDEFILEIQTLSNKRNERT